MSTAPDDLTSLLATTALVGRASTEVPVPGGAGVWVVDAADGDLLEQWTQARDALRVIGLHPVAVSDWSQGDWVSADLFSRFFYGASDDPSPEAIIARSHALTADEALGRFPRRDPWVDAHWEEVVEWHLGLALRYAGSRPPRDCFADVPAGDDMLLERRLLEWEDARRPSGERETGERFAWFDPRPHGAVGFALLPIEASCDALAYLSFYGAEGDGRHEALVRLARDWERRWGAQLMASWGTMLQWVATAPPATLDDAFALAERQARVAPSTTALPGVGVRELARHLRHGERWFLHERP